MFRGRREPARRFCYGFQDADNPGLYHYIQNLSTGRDAPITTRLEIYKATKQHMESIDCTIEYPGTAELDGAYRIVKVEKEIHHIDITRPVVIRL